MVVSITKHYFLPSSEKGFLNGNMRKRTDNFKWILYYTFDLVKYCYFSKYLLMHRNKCNLQAFKDLVTLI